MKKSVYRQHELTRRRFLGRSACAAMGVTGIVNTLTHLRLMNAAMAAGPGLSDYKAFVVLRFVACQAQPVPAVTPPCGDPSQDLAYSRIQESVRADLEKHLTRMGNPRLKIGRVEEKGENTIVAEVVTVDDSLVQRFEVDRNTGRWQRGH